MAATSAKKKIVDSRDLLLMSLSKFYHVKSNMLKVLPVLEGRSHISLRLIDYFVTNYSKKYNCVLTHTRNNNVLHFNVYLSYKSQLSAYSKQLFDPFRRRKRITFIYDQVAKKGIETTIGQLNFFRWVLDNDILEYVDTHFRDIEDDMIKTQLEMTAANNSSKDNEGAESSSPKKSTKKAAPVSRKNKKITVTNVNMNTGRRVVQFD